jgi:menaquinone-dependent protoporphyrinogen oxidase
MPQPEGFAVKILIAFASTEGQTRKISEWISARATAGSHQTRLYDSSSRVDVPRLDDFEAVIVAASVHEGSHQDRIVDFATAHRVQLRGKTTAFISVSLAAAMDDGAADAGAYVSRFTDATQWTPGSVLHLGGALRYSQYDYFERQMLKQIFARHGVEPDENDVYEYTDWTELGRFIDDFLARAAVQAA